LKIMCFHWENKLHRTWFNMSMTGKLLLCKLYIIIFITRLFFFIRVSGSPFCCYEKVLQWKKKWFDSSRLAQVFWRHNACRMAVEGDDQRAEWKPN
jgi:hypothetical protein